MDTGQLVAGLNFGRVDAETDTRYASCFIGTSMLRQVLLPQHSLLVGGKGSGKSAMFRLLCEDTQKIHSFLPKGYDTIYPVPAFGLQSEESLDGGELFDLNPTSVNDYRYFWLLYLGVKTASTLVQDARMQSMVAKSRNDKLKTTYQLLRQMLGEFGFINVEANPQKLKQRIEGWLGQIAQSGILQKLEIGKMISSGFRQRAGFNIITLLDHVDYILQETRCLAWVLLDKLDLLYIGDPEKLRTSITGLVQLLVEYSNRFKNVHFKIFLRTDIYKQLQVVNKSHLVSYTCEMRWPEHLLLKLLVARAVAEPTIRFYCQTVTGEIVDVPIVINGSDEYVKRIFYTIFEPRMDGGEASGLPPNTHEWIIRRLRDGLGNCYPREFIHLGNLAVERQMELDRVAAAHSSVRLLSRAAIKYAFEQVSAYRCDTYLYSEFPHLAKFVDALRGKESASFTRDELHELFAPLTNDGDGAIRDLHDAGLLAAVGKNVDACRKFSIPPLYKTGLGITARRKKPHLQLLERVAE